MDGFRRRAVQAVGATAPAARGTGALGRAGVLTGVQAAGCAPAAPHRRRQGQLRDTRAELGEHAAGQRTSRARFDGTHHACEARYAGRYLTEFAFRFNRRYQLVDLVPRLAYVAVRSPPLPYRFLTLL